MATTQQFIQPLAQSNTPFLANNGNPNTVYNTSATPFNNTPVTGPFGTASSPMPVNSAYVAPATQFWRNMSGVQKPVFSFENAGGVGGNTPFVPPPPPVVPPPVTTPPPPPPTIDPWTPPVQVDTPPQEAPWEISVGPIGSQFGQNSGFITNGTNTIPTVGYESVVNGLNNLVDRVSQGLGFNGRDGKFDVNQFLDALSEGVLPGNLYNENVGKWNFASIGRSILSAVIPGLGKVADWLLRKLPLENPLHQWLLKQDLQESADDANNYENIINNNDNMWQEDPFQNLDPFRGLNVHNIYGGVGLQDNWNNPTINATATYKKT